jgi:hypothetical protein
MTNQSVVTNVSATEANPSSTGRCEDVKKLPIT